MSGTTWRANARLLTGAAGRYAHLNRLRLTSLAAVLAVVAMSLVSGATAAQAAISTPFSAVFSQNTTGDILLRGNTVMTCPTAAANCTAARNTVGGTAPSNGNLNDNNYWMTFVDVDSDATTFNSSASTVDMPANASVLYAALVWGGRTAAGSTIGATPGTAPPTAADKNKVKLQVPGSSTYTDITASWTQTNATNYQGFADVTTLVAGAGNGSYTVANVQTGQGGDSHGGWALAIAYRDVDAPARNLTIFRGFGSVASGESFDIPVSGFSTPPAGAVRTTLGAVSWDGDLGSSGDQLLLGNTTGTLTNISDSQHAATNVFNSMITEKGVDSSTRNPKYTNQLGFDAATFNVDGKLPNSATSAVIRVTSASETYWPGIITFAHDLYAPNIDMTKSVSVVKAPGNIIPGLVEPGDELEYTLDGVNNGYDDATATVLTDTMPAGTTYVPASMTWNGVPKTDATGDDEAKYTSGTRTITVNLGVSASPTAGGNVAIGASTQTVTFRVTVDAVTDQQSIANTASVSYSGVLFTSSVSGASSTASSVAVQHRSNLALVKTRDLSQVVVGSSTPVTYTLTVTNNGPYGDPGVSLTDNLPGGAVLGTVTPSQGSCTTPVGQVTCNLGALANGATATVTVRAVLDGSADPATNSASVTGTNFDPSVANNTSSVSTVVDRAPVAVNDARTTTAGAVTFDPRSNDSDPDGDTLTVTAPTTTTPSRGSVVVNGNNTITYTATAGQAGTDTFTYQVSDGRGGTATATVTVTIPNTAPIAANDSSTGTPGAPVTVSVLANDSDANIPTIGSQSLSVSSVTQPAGGTGVVTTNGSTATFTPAGTFTKGTTTFTYTIADGAGGSSTADVTITVPDDAPVAADDATATPSQTAVDVDVLANDSDDNGDALTLTGVTGAAHGTATVVGSGAAARVHYVPAAGWFGADTMTYTVTDGTTPVTAQLTVTTGSAAPVAAGFSRTVSGGTPTAIDVLSHVTDSDTAAASLSTIGTAGAAHGSVSVNSSGAVVYTPNATYAGPDSFTYTVQDPEGNIATATVTLTVSNQGPAASDDTAIVPLNGSVDVNVLLNDSDGNNDPLVVSVTSGTTPHGTVTVLPSKQIRYTPTPGYLGTDSFTYTVDDGNGGTDTATVDVSVANDPPVTVSDTVVHNGPVGSALNVFVLANDSDPNGDALALDSITIVPAHGTATIVGGHVVYTPDPSYAGPDTFSYRVSDGHSAFSDGVVNVDVRNAAPIAADDTATASSAIAKTIDVLGNDSDPDTEALTLTSVSSPAHGVATVVAGKVRYLPATGFQGTDTFIYVVTDPRGATATATVTVTIGNAPPVTGPGTASTPGGTPRTIDLMQLVSDPDGQPVSITSVSSASHGTVTLDPATGKVVYNPAKGYMGPDSFCYTAADGNGAMSTACVTVHVGNTPPVANDDAAVTQYDQPIKVNVAANDSDPNGQDLTVTKVKLVKGKGTVTVTSDGLVKVTPKAGYTGVIEIDYTITDGDGGTTDATVRVRVTKPGVVPPAAESLDDTATIAVGKKAVTLDPTSIVKHHGKLAVTSITKPTDGVTVKLVDNKLVVTKKGTYVGKATFTYVVMGRDGVPVTVHQTVNVLGTSFHQSPTSPAEPQARALPHTGASNVMPIGLAGLALVGLGSLALLASVRRSTGSAE